MKKPMLMRGIAVLCLTALILPFSACSGGKQEKGKKAIVVTYSILGSVVKDLVGDSFEVIVEMPNGADPHEWEPSARDIEALNNAALVVTNGLGLEEAMAGALEGARAKGVKVFTASDHIAVRKVGAGEGIPSGDPDQAAGASDPHLWTDPVAMESIVTSLAATLKSDFGVDLAQRRDDLLARLAALDKEVGDKVAALPAERRVLVTGHESMGYFAQRYGFKLVGAAVPGLSSQAEASAAELSDLKTKINANRVPAIFVELGENPNIARTLATETGAEPVPLTTHALPEGGDYFAFIRELAGTITAALGK
jgi:zinc/manganese transport system substrate-binding protein